MNEIVLDEKACCCGRPYQSPVTVPAGAVVNGLTGCGYPAELTRLPVTYIRPQDYREGMCPGDALEAGTMFPELCDQYK